MTSGSIESPLKPISGVKPALLDLRIALVLGLMITFASAVKPMGIDDANFLFHGFQAGTAPLDPLGYQVRYETFHDTALRLPCPPVVQYWLALGYALLGDNVVLMKLWMGPWAVLLAWTSLRLARPWAGAWAVPAIAGAFVTPLVFNSLNIMIDVPAAAIMFAALLTFRAYLDAPKPDTRLSVAAGALAGLAMLAKYSACSGPVAILALAIAYRRTWAGILPGIIAAIVFWNWELLVYSKYGRSQFFYTLNSSNDPNNTPLTVLSFIGLPGTGSFILALIACLCLRAPAWVVWLLGLASLAGYTVVFFVVGSQAWLGVIAGTAFAILFVLCVRQSLKQQPATPPDADPPKITDKSLTLFLLAWTGIEMAQIIVLSPFPAGRRMIAFSFIIAIVIARTGYLLQTAVSHAALIRVFVLALPMTAITWYADLRLTQNIRDSLLNAADEIRRIDPYHENTKIYYLGLWNWQYYGPRYGLQECVPNQTVLQPGDWLISVSSGMVTPGAILNGKNYSTAGTLTSKPGISLSFLPNYIDWTCIAYFGDAAVVVDVLKTETTHVPQHLDPPERILAILKHRREPLPVGATGTLLFLAKTSPDPFHNPFVDALIKWGEPWLHEALHSPLADDRAYTQEMLMVRKNDIPPDVLRKLLNQ